MLTSQDIEEIVGQTVVDSDGDEIGKVDGVLNDGTSGEPRWLSIKSGLFGRKSSVVPLEGAQTSDGVLRVPWSEPTVQDAPTPDDDEVSSEDARLLDEHYADAGAADTGGQSGDKPITHDVDSPLRDPEKGDRREAGEMVLPEVRHGIRPKDGDEIDSARQKLGDDL